MLPNEDGASVATTCALSLLYAEKHLSTQTAQISLHAIVQKWHVLISTIKEDMVLRIIQLVTVTAGDKRWEERSQGPTIVHSLLLHMDVFLSFYPYTIYLQSMFLKKTTLKEKCSLGVCRINLPTGRSASMQHSRFQLNPFFNVC